MICWSLLQFSRVAFAKIRQEKDYRHVTAVDEQIV